MRQRTRSMHDGIHNVKAANAIGLSPAVGIINAGQPAVEPWGHISGDEWQPDRRALLRTPNHGACPIWLANFGEILNRTYQLDKALRRG
jgi:hypothetical protein